MAYTTMTSTRNGSSAIRYVLTDQKRNKEMGKSRVLISNGHNVDCENAMEQMEQTRLRFGKQGGRFVETYRVIQSFGTNELDPDNPDAAIVANEIGMALAAELYPKQEVLVVTQNDGEGGKLHNHLIVNAVSFVDGKSLAGADTGWRKLSKQSDKVVAATLGVAEPLPGAKQRISRKEQRLRDAGEFVWKDELRERIETALAVPTVVSREGFVDEMAAMGVEVRFGGKKGNKDLKGKPSYSFVDSKGDSQHLRGTKLGEAYGGDAIDAAALAHAKAAEEAARKAEQEEAKRLDKEKREKAAALLERNRGVSRGMLAKIGIKDVSDALADEFKTTFQELKGKKQKVIESSVEPKPHTLNSIYRETKKRLKKKEADANSMPSSTVIEQHTDEQELG